MGRLRSGVSSCHSMSLRGKGVGKGEDGWRCMRGWSALLHFSHLSDGVGYGMVDGYYSLVVNLHISIDASVSLTNHM